VQVSVHVVEVPPAIPHQRSGLSCLSFVTFESPSITTTTTTTKTHGARGFWLYRSTIWEGFLAAMGAGE